jgi:K+ transporter
MKSRGVSAEARSLPLSLVALGVVFGDIGTSPLCAFKECLRNGATPADVYSFVSLIIWSLILLARLEITAMNDRFFRVIAHFGFMEIPTIEKIAEAAAAQNFELRPNKTTFFLGRETLVPASGKALSRLRRSVFRLMSRNAENAADFFQLPSDRTMEIGFPVEL